MVTYQTGKSLDIFLVDHCSFVLRSKRVERLVTSTAAGELEILCQQLVRKVRGQVNRLTCVSR